MSRKNEVQNDFDEIYGGRKDKNKRSRNWRDQRHQENRKSKDLKREYYEEQDSDREAGDWD